MRAVIAFFCFAFAAILPAQAMDIERVVSPGGIEAWLVQEDEVPVVVMEIAWKGGAATDPEGKSGVANMVSGLLDEGAGELTSEEFQIRMEEIAARMSFSADSDHFNATLITLANHKDEAFDLFSKAISEPRFDDDAVERIRKQIATIVARNRQSPDWIARNSWYKAAFGDHPYARDEDGTPESVAAITRDDLLGYTDRVLAQDNVKISVVGPVSPSELRNLLDRTFGGLPAKAQVADVPKVDVTGNGEVQVVVRDFPQSVMIFGLQGIARDDPDFIPAYVMNYILGGGGFSSRLTEEVREKRGLAYSIGTYLYPMDHAAMWLGQVGTKNERVGQTLSLVRKELARMAEEGVTAEELKDAKTYLTGSYPLRFISNRSIANQLLGIQLGGYGIDYVDRRNALIEAVTREDVARVAKRLLKPDNLRVTIVGKPNLSPEPEGLPETDDMAPARSGGPSERRH
ncbi:pitrilysin family protein [Parvibaculum sp.]|jgi:zinc protease|uniref:M16 family metallopeptidase n=1 Tax=Parvibaculum sp. TaxID=2024848 RepID=UPI000C3FF4F6|nr:pitrilysin family protein [Parvibaculum sp.]MAM95081.1 peptidase M16 [Parvibaculum sp.]HCX67858.1 peptidase M16 [Rhodobiaceae bacterium]|tara:strand:- start:2485 stop:3861 length:1377 start_codon:yes stop_codon:yes gene_type:complete